MFYTSTESFEKRPKIPDKKAFEKAKNLKTFHLKTIL